MIFIIGMLIIYFLKYVFSILYKKHVYFSFDKKNICKMEKTKILNKIVINYNNVYLKMLLHWQ